jgi:hypothetical protein
MAEDFPWPVGEALRHHERGTRLNAQAFEIPFIFQLSLRRPWSRR